MPGCGETAVPPNNPPALHLAPTTLWGSRTTQLALTHACQLLYYLLCEKTSEEITEPQNQAA